MSSPIRQDSDDVLVFVRAKPRASKSRVLGQRDGELEVALKAPPVDGAANDELLQFVAKKLGVARSRVTLERGEASRHKVLRLRSATVQVVVAELTK